jgi:hypothetical protein
MQSNIEVWKILREFCLHLFCLQIYYTPSDFRNLSSGLKRAELLKAFHQRKVFVWFGGHCNFSFSTFCYYSGIQTVHS